MAADPVASLEVVPFLDAFVSVFDERQALLVAYQCFDLARSIVTISAHPGVPAPDWGLRSLRALFIKFTAPIPRQLTSLHLIFATVSSKSFPTRHRLLNL